MTHRDTWPHEYVLSRKDGQRDLFEAVRARMRAGEGLQGRFFGFTTTYLFVGEYKCWFMTPHDEINLDATEDDYVLNRARLYRDRRDFLIQDGDTARGEDYPGPPRQEYASNLDEPAPTKSGVVRTSPIKREMTDLADRCRGTMVGLAVGNLMGVRHEGWSRHHILGRYPGGIREIDALPGYPDDDDLAQAVILADACLASDRLEVGDVARRFWEWGEKNGLGMGRSDQTSADTLWWRSSAASPRIGNASPSAGGLPRTFRGTGGVGGVRQVRRRKRCCDAMCPGCGPLDAQRACVGLEHRGKRRRHPLRSALRLVLGCRQPMHRRPLARVTTRRGRPLIPRWKCD